MILPLKLRPTGLGSGIDQGRRGRGEPADPFGLRMSSLERAVLLHSVVMFVVSTVAFSVPR